MDQDSNPNSRRAALRAGAALLGAAAVSADIAAQATKPPSSGASAPVGLTDPRSAYPKPPFQK